MEMWRRNLRTLTRLPHGKILAIYGIFTGPLLLLEIVQHLQDHRPWTILEFAFCFLFLPLAVAFIIAMSWLSVYFFLPLSIDENGLIRPAGRALGFWILRPTRCAVSQDSGLPHVYYLTIFSRKRVLCRYVIRNPDQAAPFIAAFHRFYGAATIREEQAEGQHV